MNLNYAISNLLETHLDIYFIDLIQSMLLLYEFKFQLDKLNRIQIYTI